MEILPHALEKDILSVGDSCANCSLVSVGGGAEGFHPSIVASGKAGDVAAFTGRLGATASGRACAPNGDLRTVASSASSSAIRRCAASRSDLFANMLAVFGLLLEFMVIGRGYLLSVKARITAPYLARKRILSVLLVRVSSAVLSSRRVCCPAMGCDALPMISARRVALSAMRVFARSCAIFLAGLVLIV